MSGTQTPPCAGAAAFRLLGYLDVYEDDLRLVTEEWPCPHTRARLGAQIDFMRSEAAALPQLIVPWVEFLISHETLIEALGHAGSTLERLDQLENHIQLILGLQGECLEVLTGKRHMLQTSHMGTAAGAELPAARTERHART